MPRQLLPEGSLYHAEIIKISANSTTGDGAVKGARFLIYQESSDISEGGTFHGFISLSFARAIQQPALAIWQGDAPHVLATQQALYYRASCNRAARRGEYNATMKRK
jgi:hypothetical protein